MTVVSVFCLFFSNDTATAEIYTLSLHDALPISEALKRASTRGGDTVILLQITVLDRDERGGGLGSLLRNAALHMLRDDVKDRKSTRLNSSHANISYAVFCLKKKNTMQSEQRKPR